MGSGKTPKSESPAFSSTLLQLGSQADRCCLSPLTPPNLTCPASPLPQRSSAGRWRGGAGVGDPARVGSVSRASGALEVVAGRGWLGEWVAELGTEAGGGAKWGPGPEGEPSVE